MATPPTHGAVAFGLRWESDLPLHRFRQTAAEGFAADVVVRRSRDGTRAREVTVAFGGAALCTDGIRWSAGTEASFDTFGPGLVEWSPGETWTGAFPAAFFATLAALLLAWRGRIPIHGTAVEVRNRGLLVCGPSGAGKSTLGAGLIALGGRLVSDDLSILLPAETAGPGVLYAGRPTMRLHPRIAAFLKAARPTTEIALVDGGKDDVRPAGVSPFEPVPLTAMIVLGAPREAIEQARIAALLQAQLFRPRWMASIPGFRERRAGVLHAARALRVVGMPEADVRDERTFLSRAEDALRAVEDTRR